MLARAAAPRTRVFCPIWKRPWMAVGHDTFADDLMRVCGGENVFADRRERRYPIVEEAEIAAAAPEVILLPDEPYAFGPRDAAELARLPVPAAQSGRIHCVDGTLVSWYGARIAVYWLSGTPPRKTRLSVPRLTPEHSARTTTSSSAGSGRETSRISPWPG